MIDETQMIQEFLELAAFSAPSKGEQAVRACLREKLVALGFAVSQDEAFGQSGNLYARLEGELPLPPLLFCAHMDTVTPCAEKRITVEPSGAIHTDGTTILGADDVSGIVEILAAARSMLEDGGPHRPIELLFTASEEYFVEGAQLLDYSRVRAREAYVLDTDGTIGRGVRAAPTGIRLVVQVSGRAAHAALAPEDGVNAVAIAAAAISHMRLGRVDRDTTANIGIIRGGDSGNIVPGSCLVEGETRSLSHEKALRQRDHMVACFEEAALAAGGRCEVTAQIVYPAYEVPEDHVLCRRFADACGGAGVTVKLDRACGGSDASFLSQHGIDCLVLATGMHEIHSVSEYTTVAELRTMAQVTERLMRSHM